MASQSPSTRFATVRVTLPIRREWDELAWSAFDAAGEFVACGSATPDNVPTHSELDVVVPAGRIAAHQLHLPPQEKKHLDALVGQAMDDRLLGDKADAVSVVAAPNGAGRTVWVCSRRWLEGALGRLASAGLRVDRVFPEYELLPPDAVATVCVETIDGTLFRSAERGFGLLDTPASVALLTGQHAVRTLPDGSRLPRPPVCTNLLSAGFGGFAKTAFDPRPWRRPALLLAISASLLLLANVIHWRQLEGREKRLQHEIRQTFATAFPGTPIIDPLLQWESKARERAAVAAGDALDAVLMLAGRLDLPLHPRRVEARDGWVRLTLTDSEAAQFKSQLDAAGSPETTPAEAGYSRLQFRSAP